MADSSRVSVRMALESTWGTAPAGGPAWHEVPITSIAPRTNQETIQSAIIVPDAQIRAIIRTSRFGAPDIGYEFGYGWNDVILEAALRGDWQAGVPIAGTDRLENGVVLKSMSMEVAFTDIGLFVTFTGLRVNTYDLNIETGAIMSGTVTFLGKGGAVSGASVAGAFTPAPDVTPMNSVDNITLLEEGGTTLGDGLALSLSLNNNGRIQPVLAQLDPRGIGLGQIVLTGTLQAYFEDASIYSKFLGFTESNINFEATDEAGNAYLFNILAFRYSGGDPDVGGNNEDTDIEHTWEAYRDAATQKTLRIERTPA